MGSSPGLRPARPRAASLPGLCRRSFRQGPGPAPALFPLTARLCRPGGQQAVNVFAAARSAADTLRRPPATAGLFLLRNSNREAAVLGILTPCFDLRSHPFVAPGYEQDHAQQHPPQVIQTRGMKRPSASVSTARRRCRRISNATRRCMRRSGANRPMPPRWSRTCSKPSWRGTGSSRRLGGLYVWRTAPTHNSASIRPPPIERSTDAVPGYPFLLQAASTVSSSQKVAIQLAFRRRQSAWHHWIRLFVIDHADGILRHRRLIHQQRFHVRLLLAHLSQIMQAPGIDVAPVS